MFYTDEHGYSDLSCQDVSDGIVVHVRVRLPGSETWIKNLELKPARGKVATLQE